MTFQQQIEALKKRFGDDVVNGFMIQILEDKGYEVRNQRSAYRTPLLISLLEMGGKGRRSDVHSSVGRKMGYRLTQTDRDPIPSKPIVVWQNEVDFVRNDLREEGLIASGSQRGIWELTLKGKQEAERLTSDHPTVQRVQGSAKDV